mmetsp:Transcript_19916/g.43567  ORF Transcript_19916/g.43567 Transcript_19916/m.43567 type:complete len:675 (-) Transcript_19916:182-2206(-)
MNTTACLLPCASVAGVPKRTCARATSALPSNSLWGSGLKLSKGSCALTASVNLESSTLRQGTSRGGLVVTAGKKDMKKKAAAKARQAGGGGKGGGGGGKSFKSPGEVKEGSAYATETRKTILTMQKVGKVAPSGKQILKNISLGMYLGAKIGILGSNGSGKSTLMKILAQEDKNFDGECELVDGIKIGYLQQEPPLDDGPTVESNIEPALAEMRGMLKEFEEVSMAMAEPDADVDGLMKTMDRLQTQIDAANGWEIERIKERAMDALRCPPPDALVENLSGGERRRVAICRLLLSNPDILLLDEPTNHLDAASVAWLERFLADFQGTVVAVTHDRYFLDNVAGWILELDRGQGIPFEGNYSQWLADKDQRLSQEKRQQSSLKKQIEAELEWVNKMAKGQQKKGKARLRRYDDLVAAQAEYTNASTLDSIVIPTPVKRLGDVVVEAKDLSKGFGDRLLIEGANFVIPPGAVVGIVGPNGAGKTTLFRMIMDQQAPDGGELKIGDTVVPMYVDQSREEQLANDKTVYEELSEGNDEVVLGSRSIAARQYCSWYNFAGADQQKKVGSLSGGERNRLQLAKTLKSGGNLLMLDEPTNDLDVDTLRSLEEAIDNFAGTTVIISHDRWFLDRLATHIMAYEGDSKVVWFEGSYSEYEADRRRRMGDADPTRIKYRPMALA